MIRDIKKNWWEEKAKLIQAFADQYDMHNFFLATKTIYESGLNNHTTLQSKDGTLLKDDTAFQQRWREHFELLFNRETVEKEHTILSIPKHSERPLLDILPTPDEVQRATMQMRKP